MNASIDTAKLTCSLFLSLLSVYFFLLFSATCPGLVDALRCLQWLLWLACLSVLDSHSLDSVGQELISRERHEHSHPSRGGYSRHLIPGHGCGLRVSNTDTRTERSLFTPYMPPHFLPSFIIKYLFWPSSSTFYSQFQCFFFSHFSKAFPPFPCLCFHPFWCYLHVLDTLIWYPYLFDVPVPFSSLSMQLIFFR